MQKRLNLWQRLKPEYKKQLKKENKKWSYKMNNIKQELKSTEYFTEVRYGIAFDVMIPNKLTFLGDAFNSSYADE
jgi:ribosomal protein RSM22 (predicted rRNA methylase)